MGRGWGRGGDGKGVRDGGLGQVEIRRGGVEWERELEWWRRWEGGERTGGDGKGGEFRRGRDEKERGGGIEMGSKTWRWRSRGRDMKWTGGR